MSDFPTRQTWLDRRGTTPIRERPFYSGGTYVRPRGDPTVDKRLSWYQQQCNANAQAPLRRELRRRAGA